MTHLLALSLALLIASLDASLDVSLDALDAFDALPCMSSIISPSGRRVKVHSEAGASALGAASGLVAVVGIEQECLSA